MANLPVVLHERLGYWARHLRPRLPGWPVRWVETRSTADLHAALEGASCPIVLIDLGHRPRAGLEDLGEVHQVAPNSLSLVLNPLRLDGVPVLARRLGATHVMSGIAPPPLVADLLERWLPLARQRRDSQGWCRELPPEPEPEPWNWLSPLLAEPLRPAR
ncbi:MAG: hypothetical protein P4L84_00520 [Isosphaeraceae bacterium]|nr:hypothetical protein [Isosphaeraceae bacterium]